MSEHRAEFGRSPTANFGRMPDGWVKSSGNNRQLAGAGRLVRGHPDPRATRPADHPPVLDLGRDPTAPDWAGLPWSAWSPPLAGEATTGVYRIRRPGDERIVYVGQGLVRARLAAHVAKGRRTDHRQHAVFSQSVDCSWVALPGRSSAQLLEVECDLIASHALVTGPGPAAQFLG